MVERNDLVKLEKVLVKCPSCGREVEAIARDGVVKGWCAISRQDVKIEITQ